MPAMVLPEEGSTLGEGKILPSTLQRQESQKRRNSKLSRPQAILTMCNNSILRLEGGVLGFSLD